MDIWIICEIFRPFSHCYLCSTYNCKDHVQWNWEFDYCKLVWCQLLVYVQVGCCLGNAYRLLCKILCLLDESTIILLLIIFEIYVIFPVGTQLHPPNEWLKSGACWKSWYLYEPHAFFHVLNEANVIACLSWLTSPWCRSSALFLVKLEFQNSQHLLTLSLPRVSPLMSKIVWH